MPSLLELQDLYTEALIRELIEKTKSGGVTWGHMGGTQFSATKEVSGVEWAFYATKTQIGNLSYKYALDIKKDGVTHLSTTSGSLGNSSRDSMVKELYEIVEIIVLQLDAKMKETIQLIQNLPNARP